MLPYNFKINFSKKLLVQITNLTNFIDLLNKIIFLRNKRKLRKMCQQYLLWIKFSFPNYKKQIIRVNNKFKIFFTNSNMHLSFISNKQLVFNMCIGEYQTLIGPNRALWKKKNVKYKKLMFELFYQLLEYSHFNINFIYIKNFKNTFLLFLKYLKFINFIKILIKDTTHYTRIKLKKKTYIKRRISRKLNYINPLKM